MPTAYENRISAQNPTLWLKLDGSGAPTSSGSSTPTFTLSGTAPTTGVSGGISNTCYTFNGNGHYSIGSLPTLTLTNKNFTMEAWVKMSPSTTQDYPTIYRADNGANGIFIMRVRGNNITNPGFAEIYMKGSSSSLTLLSTSRVDDNDWHHIAFRYDGFSYFLYIDGVQQATGSTSIGTVTDIDSAGTRYFGSGNVANEHFVGSIDEFTIYGTNINPGLTFGNFANGKYPTSMQAKISNYTPEWYFEMDAADNTSINMNNYGSQTDANTWTRTTTSPSTNITRVATTLPSSTANPYMFSIPYASRYRSTTSQLWSTELTDKNFVFGIWWKLNTGTSSASALTYIGGFGTSACLPIMYSQTHASTPGRVFWNVAGVAQAGTIRVDDYEWHFLAVRSTGDNTYRCYVDGVLDTTITTSNTISVSNMQVGDSTQGSASGTSYVDSMFLAPASNITEANLLEIYQTAFPSATNGGYAAEVMTITTSTFQDPVVAVEDNNDYNATAMTADTAVFVDPVVTTDLSFNFNAPALLVTDSTLVGPSVQTDTSTEVSAAEMTASSEFPQPTLSITLDMTWYATSMDASSEFGVDPAISTDGIILVDPMTAETIDTMASIILDDGYTAIPAIADASFSLVDPVVTTESDTTFNASPATASATSGDHKRLNLWVVYPDKDVTGSAQSISAVTDSTILEVTRLAQPERASGIKFTIPSFINSGNLNNITKVALELTSAAISDGTTFVLSGFVNDWEESGVYNLISLVNPQLQIGVTFANTNTTIEIDDTYITSANPVGSTLKTFISQWVNGTNPNYGFRLVNNGQPNTEYYFHSSEAGIVAYRPKLIIYGDFGPMEVNFQPAPMTASALMSDPNIIAGQSDDNLADPLLASADKVMPAISAGTGVIVALTPADHLEAFGELIAQPSITTEQGVIAFQNGPMDANAQFEHPLVAASGLDATIDTAPFNANASLPMPGIRQDDGAVANTMVAFNAELVDPTVAADTIELVFAEPMLMRFAFLPPEEAVDETSDPYYQEILKTTNLYDSAWYRLDEISGSTVVSKTKEINAANLQQDASFVGVPVFGNVGPRLRKTITFTGSQYITIPNPYGATGTSGNIDWLGAAGTQVTEITLKTIQTKGTILYGTDANTLAGAGIPQFWMLDIYNGRLRFRSGSDFRGVHLVRPDGLVIGNKLINDGEFHHIVIQLGNQLNSKQLEIYVDGQLDIARFNAPAGLGAHPDFIAGDGRPTRLFAYDTISYVPGNLEETPYFAGEIMEYVFRPNVTLTEYQIQQLFYRALDIEVKSFPSVTATAEMPEPFVDAGKPKALILSFWATSDYRDTGAFSPPLDEEPEYTRLIAGGFAPETFDTWEYYVNRVSANPQLTFIGATPGTAGVHRDPVTDEVVLLDPRTIPNIDKFRVIQIQGYPLDSNDVNGIFAGYNEEKGYQHALKALETFVGQVREIIDTYGTSLLVTNPRLAVDLGIVDDVEYADPLFETRFSPGQSLQNSGLYDYRSAQVDPLANPDGIGTGGFIEPFSYFDTHRNNRLRIVATQTGLTDIPDAWTLEDAVTKIPYDPLSMEEYSYKYKDTRTTGLTIGQEIVIINHQLSKNQFGGANGDAYNTIRATDPVICFPPGSVKTGTVIARMANTYWNEQAQIANPYANYASIIVVNPGDSLKGTTVGGKIFVNCTERVDATYSNFAPFQTTNASETNPIIPGIQTEAGTAYEKEWQYSTGRLLQAKNGSFEPVGTTGGTAGAVRRNLSKLADKRLAAFKTRDGSIYYREVLTSQLFTLFVDEKYPVVLQWAPSMMERGIIWLLDREAISPNDAVIRPTTFIATITAPNSGLYINQDRTVSVPAMLATSRIVEPGESTPVDANSTALPMFAQARITGFARFINATPMTVSARFNTDLVTFAGGEQVVVTLPEIIRIELFMKEDSY